MSTVTLALTAAHSGSASRPIGEPPVLLWLETARDHLRSIALDWPQRQTTPGLDAHAMAWLHACPLSLATPRTPDSATTASQTLALAVAALSPDDTESARMLASDYDPCVACTVTS